MEALYIEHSGNNLRELFTEKVIETDKYIRESFDGLQRIKLRFSPAVSASIYGGCFTVEVNQWVYRNEEKEICYLDTMFDVNEAYFEIRLMPILTT